MFNKGFYPTPNDIINKMLGVFDLNGKNVLEPSAGKGDIIDILKERGAHVTACELNNDLAAISEKKANRFLKNDFFDVQSSEISHIDYIFMNPPFSNWDKHILHAFDIAPEGCTIVSLCNYDSYRYGKGKSETIQIIADNGTIENLGEAFSTAERKTNVNIGLIILFKPKTGKNEFEDYLFSEEQDEQNFDEGLVSYNYIRDIVGRYIQGVQLFDDVINNAKKINSVISPLGGNFRISFNARNYSGSDYSIISRNEYKKELQKSAWKTIFSEMKMDKYLTRSVFDQVNKFVEKQSNMPFTMKNISVMIDIIVGTHGERMEKVVGETFDWLTKHHDGNRESVEGWKTNSMYFVGKKFIAPYCGVTIGYSGQPEISYSRGSERIDELVKALCYITGENFDNKIKIRDFFAGKQINEVGGRVKYEYKKFGKWYDFNYFEIKVFKKGTLHAKFKDEKVREMFNKIAVKSKGWRIPSRTGSDVRRKNTDLELFNIVA